MSSIKFHSYLGLGDQVYMRPFVLGAKKKYRTVDVVTPFPDLFYAHRGIGCIKPTTILKTQKEWADNAVFDWVDDKKKYKKVLKMNYSGGFYRNLNVIQSFKEQSRVIPVSFQFQMPNSVKNKAKAFIDKYNTDNKPICFFRPPTIRAEWENSARNAPMTYFERLLSEVKETHFIVSCTDLREGKEKLDGELPKSVDLCIHYNEIGLDGSIGLMNIADFIIGIQSNIIPFSCAFEVPCFVVYGGYVPHEALTDPFMGLDKLRYVQPDPFCFCVNGKHECNKLIGGDRLLRTFNNFRREVLWWKK